jgi:hypothetical protein
VPVGSYNACCGDLDEQGEVTLEQYLRTNAAAGGDPHTAVFDYTRHAAETWMSKVRDTIMLI